MSEQQNLKVVQDAYAAFGRGDIPSLLTALSDDIEWHSPGEGLLPQGGTHRGKEAITRFFQIVDETTQFETLNPHTFVAQGENVVALGHYDGTVKTTGRPFDADFVMVFTFRGGKVARFQEFTDTAALATAFMAKAA